MANDWKLHLLLHLIYWALREVLVPKGQFKLKFRENKVALVGDMYKLYKYVRISTTDQHSLRLLTQVFSPTTTHWLVSRLETCLSGVIEENSRTVGGRLSKISSSRCYKNSRYVDEILNFESSVENDHQIAREKDHVLGNNGFMIKHWIISPNYDKTAHGIKLLNINTEKVLGFVWRHIHTQSFVEFYRESKTDWINC